MRLLETSIRARAFQILVLFQRLYAEGHTIIFVTHNPDIANYSSRNIEIRDGRVISDTVNHNIKSAGELWLSCPRTLMSKTNQ